MSVTFNGAAGAPLVGIFVLGVFFPWVNSTVMMNNNIRIYLGLIEIHFHT